MSDKIHIVQVGLNKSTEYAFLLDSANRETKRGKHPLPLNWDRLGLARNDARIEYHGIEPNPVSYQALIDKIGIPKQHNFYNLAISDTNGDIEIYDYLKRHGKSKDKEAKIKTPSRTLETFFREAGIDRCHLLVMDIQGWEYDALRAYKGNIPIEFAIIEFHAKKNRYTRKKYPHSCDIETFERLIAEKGFAVTSRYVSNSGVTYDYHLEQVL